MGVEISETAKMGYRISVISISNKVKGTANTTVVCICFLSSEIFFKKKLNFDQRLVKR